MIQTYDYSKIEWLDSTDSTNLDIRRRIDTLANLSVIAARVQTAGRGRGDHHWVSPAGENLTFSLLLRFGEGGFRSLPASESIRITHMAAVSVFTFLRDEGVEPRIKWPNDIWVGSKKICGMLIENILDGQDVAASIIGIGLNLNQDSFDPSLPNPVSLSMITGRKYNTDRVLEKLYNIICRHASMLDSADGRYELERIFSDNVFHLDKPSQENIDSAIVSFEELQRLKGDRLL